MRTTITIEDGLMKRLREEAAARRVSVSRLIQDAVRASLGAQKHNASQPPFELVVAGGNGLADGSSWADLKRAVEHDDIHRLGEDATRHE